MERIPGRRSRSGASATAVAAWVLAVGAASLQLPTPGAAQSAAPAPDFLDDRVPVLLVPGWMASDRTMGPLRELFLQAGWPPHWVESFTFHDRVGSNRDHAVEIAQAVAELRERTGARRVDVVAHSMGGLATRLYLQDGGAGSVRRVIFVATPHHGTLVANLAWGEGGAEMRPGSPFLLELGELRGVPPGVEALTLRTPVDFHVLPPSSATLTGVPDVEVCCPGHEGILNHPDAFQVMQAFLIRGAQAALQEGAGG